MSVLLDDISRIIASSVSRREVLKLVGGTVGGAMLASLGWSQSSPPKVTCGKRFCPTGDTCCHGKICCPPGSQCCGPLGSPFCCLSGCVCCQIQGKGFSEQV